MKMTTLIKRIFSLAMCLILVQVMMPISVYAFSYSEHSYGNSVVSSGGYTMNGTTDLTDVSVLTYITPNAGDVVVSATGDDPHDYMTFTYDANPGWQFLGWITYYDGSVTNGVSPSWWGTSKKYYFSSANSINTLYTVNSNYIRYNKQPGTSGTAAIYAIFQPVVTVNYSTGISKVSVKYTYVYDVGRLNVKQKSSSETSGYKYNQDYGAPLTATYVLKDGYVLQSVNVSGSSAYNPTNYHDAEKQTLTFSSVKGPLNISINAKIKEQKVNYNSNGGTGTMKTQTFEYGKAQTLAQNTFTRTGYSFEGWNTEANGSGTNYTNGQSATFNPVKDGDSITLYAQWKKLPVAQVSTAPKANDLTYIGSAQNLVTAGTSNGGELLYSLDNSSWSNVIPTGTIVGDYTVYYYVKADSEHTDSEVQSIPVTIKTGNPSYNIPTNLTATYGDTLSNVTLPSVEGGTWTWQDAPDTSVGNAGTNRFKATFTPDNKNYNTIKDIEIPITVNKATLTVTASDETVTYGDVAPNYTVTYDGFKNGDDKDDLGGKLKFTCKYAQFSDIDEYIISASGYESDNYIINYGDGELTVNPKPITVTIANKTSVYGDEIVALTADDNGGIVNNDTNVYSLATTATKNSSVEKYDITGTTLDDNYSITFKNGTYEITQRELTVDVVVADKQYDGLNTATITSAILNNVAEGDKGKITLVNGIATFETVNVADNIGIDLTDFALSGEADILKNYYLTQPASVKANIINGWIPVADKEFTTSVPNSNGWLNKDLVVTANDGYELSPTNTAEGVWSETLTGAVEGEDSSVTYYVRNTTTGVISEAVTVTYKLDKNTETTGITGKVYFDERNGWEQFLNNISFNLFYKGQVTVKVEASDTLSGVASIEYVSSDKAMTLDEVKAINDWNTMPTDGIGVTIEDAKQFVYIIRITDNAGNVTYLSTDGAEYDTTAPVVEGIENGKTYYTTQKVTIIEKNIDSITLNGETATNSITLEGNVDKTYTIIATDKADNSTTVTVNMKTIDSIATPIEGITEENVKPFDKEDIDNVIAHVDELLKDGDLTDNEKAALEEIKSNADKFIVSINIKMRKQKVNYNANGGVGTMEEQIFEYGKAQNLRQNVFTRREYSFEGWNTEADGSGTDYTDIQSVTFNPANDGDIVTLYAQWKKLPEAQVLTAPKANDLTYTGYEQELVTAGTANGGELLYSLDNRSWSNVIPTGTNAGDYTVYYYVKADSEHIDSEVQSISITVDKATSEDETKNINKVNENTGNKISPNTGYNTNIWMWLVIALISGSLAMTIAITDKKKRTETNR